jgi:molybdopterin-guanine dinucleotide biosynthesis protein B
MLSNAKVPIVGIAAYSGSGKTTLLTRLIPLFTAADIRVGVVKHAHHRFDIDQPGKDSYRLREAGAGQILLGSRHRLALLMEQNEQRPEPCLNELLAMLDQTRLELILVEGFKHETFPKLELNRPATGKPLMYPDDPSIIALITDVAGSADQQLPELDLNQPERVFDFIRSRILNAAPETNTLWATP